LKIPDKVEIPTTADLVKEVPVETEI